MDYWNDLIEHKIRVARGEELINRRFENKGHAMELRVYAEDPMNDFLPSVGHLDVYQLPVGEEEFVWITVLNKAWIFYLLRSDVGKINLMEKLVKKPFKL
jgi:acetyl/propionyl-CoA carboxylase alpha subunit